MNLEYRTSVDIGRFKLGPYVGGTKINGRTCRDDHNYNYN